MNGFLLHLILRGSLVRLGGGGSCASWLSPMQNGQKAGRKSEWQWVIDPHRFEEIDAEVRLAVLTPFLFDKPIEASEAILQFGLQSLEGARQLLWTAVVVLPGGWLIK